jgi:hypothetical protein
MVETGPPVQIKLAFQANWSKLDHVHTYIYIHTYIHICIKPGLQAKWTINPE